MRRCTTGTPTPQLRATRLSNATNGRPELSTRARRSAASLPVRSNVGGVTTEANAVATARPNEAMPACSTSSSLTRCLNRASSRQRKRGSSLWESSELGSSPSRRAMPKRSSARADGDPSASSLHQRGHAASIAGSARPRCFSWARSCAALSMIPPRFPPDRARAGRTRRSARQVLLHDVPNRPRSAATPRRGASAHRRPGGTQPECNCIAGGTRALSVAARDEVLVKRSVGLLQQLSPRPSALADACA